MIAPDFDEMLAAAEDELQQVDRLASALPADQDPKDFAELRDALRRVLATLERRRRPFHLRSLAN